MDYCGMALSIAHYLRHSLSRRRGSVAIQVGILMTVLLGMASLGMEIPFLIFRQRQMQSAADAAALGAAVALARGYPAIATEGQGIAAASGFTNAKAGVTVAIDNPPKSGAYTANAAAVEAVISQPQTLKLAGLFGAPAFKLSARAVALQGSAGGSASLLVE
jgi:uncharacterized membrane protein